MMLRSVCSRILVTGMLVSSGLHLAAQDETSRRHGRKYKAPPATAHIEVYVTKKATGKPVVNAAVIFRALREGKDDGNLEVKTDPDGKATIDVIAAGSLVQVHIALLKPQEQVSAYEDNSGKESGRKAGVQEPRAVPKPPLPPPAPAKSAPPTPAPATPSESAPPQ